jgi:NAD kinase
MATVSRLNGNAAYISVDGGTPVILHNGDNIYIKRSVFETTLARVRNRSFYEILNEKLATGNL